MSWATKWPTFSSMADFRQVTQWPFCWIIGRNTWPFGSAWPKPESSLPSSTTTSKARPWSIHWRLSTRKPSFSVVSSSKVRQSEITWPEQLGNRQFCVDVSQVVNELDPSVACYCFDSGSSQLPSWSKSLDASLEAASDAPLGGKQRANYKDKMMYIYTSGTTGLPKAAIIRHSR